MVLAFDKTHTFLMMQKNTVTVQIISDVFGFKEQTRSLLVHESIANAEIGQIRDALNSDTTLEMI